MPGGREKTRQRRVALLIESTRAYARELILGIARFNQERTHWRVEFTPRGIDDSPPTWLKAWRGDGILARIDTSRMARALTEKKVPVVDLRRAVHREGLPQVGPDDVAVSEMVFEHFQQRGFRRFGFVSLPPGTHKAMDRRAEHFRELVDTLGCAHHQLNVKAVTTGDRWEKMCRQIERWIKRIDRPCAIMTCNDDLGLQVLDACRRLDIRVPDEIAVAGVGNDVCLCDLALPGLTSVDLNPQRIGYEAAALLDRMMHGKTITDREALIAPARIVARQSTDVVAAEDPHVAEALVFIRDQACRGIQVADVLRQVHLSRAALEPRFKQAIGRTVHQEIQRIRLARVQELLTATDMPIKQIARLAGFRYPEYMMRIFRQATGQTLKQYRKGLKT